MDVDELLARALQEEEYAAAPIAQRLQHSEQDARAVISRDIQSNIDKAKSVEDAAAIRAALAVMPLRQLRQGAQQTAELNRQLADDVDNTGSDMAVTEYVGEDDLVVQGLLKWFKHNFFSWVDQPWCDVCGSTTSLSGMAAPTPAEAAHGAGRVEEYRCTVCGQVTRFPRYTDPIKLLETRKGRCGEWAHTFLLVLRAAGLDARHVSDSADHVWCEYYSASLGRWVHVDSCEQSWDQALLYEGGWGKKLAYVFAASRHGVADVTRRYVVQPQQLSSRRHLVPEAWLSSHLVTLTGRMRSHLDPASRRSLAMRDATEALQLMALESDDDSPNSAAAAASAALPGRQSGSAAWRAARGETGTSDSNARASNGPCTHYRPASDARLPALFGDAGRLTGGVCRASGENAGEEVQRAFDGCLSSKWLDFAGGGDKGSAWLQYCLLPSQQPAVISHYNLISAEDCPERDPCDWVLECIVAEPQTPTPAAAAAAASVAASSDSQAMVGSSIANELAIKTDGTSKSANVESAEDVNAGTSGSSSSSSTTQKRAAALSSSAGTGSVGWVVLDQKRGQYFSRRHQLRSFILPPAARVTSRRWRLRISKTSNPSAANSVQLACWNLYCSNSTGSSSHVASRAAGSNACQQPQQKDAERPAAAPAVGVASVVSSHSGLLYLTQSSCKALAECSKLQAATSATGKTGDMQAVQVQTAVAAPADSSTSIPTEAVSTFRRIVSNMQQHPNEPKYWQLSACAPKLQPLLQAPLLLAALLAVGFRPVIADSNQQPWGRDADGAASGTSAQQPQQLRLVADETGNHAAVSTVSELLRL